METTIEITGSCPHCGKPLTTTRSANSIVANTVTCGNSYCQEKEYYACMARSKAKKRKRKS